MKRQRTSGPVDIEAVYSDQEAYGRQLMAGAAFPVFGWVHEAGGVLAEFEVGNGGLESVEIRSGDWSSAPGPYVTVRTYRPGAEQLVPLPDLEDAVEDERDRVYEHIGVDEGEVPGRVRALREWITVDGEPRAVQVHEDSRTAAGHGTVWAGRLRVDGATVTVTGRGVPPGAVELRRIVDFEQYILGRTALLRELAERRADRAEPAPEPAELGLQAHRELLEQGIARALAVEAQLRAGRSARLPRRLRGEDQQVRWEAAVRQQMRLASESREEADEAVTSMVNHLSRLAHHVDWLSGTPAGAAAVEEVVRFTAFASEVPSLPAQRAWERLWAGGTPEVPSGTEDAWLTAWELWRVERTQHLPRR